MTAGVKGCNTASVTRGVLDEMINKGLGIWSDIKKDLFVRL